MRIRQLLLIPTFGVVLLGACDDSPAGPVALAPGAPIEVAATIGDGSVSLAFAPPRSDGGAPITAYIATCTAAGASLTGSGATSPVPVTGLVNGTEYSCTVAAENSVGRSAPSDGVTVTPAASE